MFPHGRSKSPDSPCVMYKMEDRLRQIEILGPSTPSTLALMVTCRSRRSAAISSRRSLRHWETSSRALPIASDESSAIAASVRPCIERRQELRDAVVRGRYWQRLRSGLQEKVEHDASRSCLLGDVDADHRV